MGWSPVFASDYAVEVVDSSAGYPSDWPDPQTVLGRPTVDTVAGPYPGGPPPLVPLPVVPVYGAYRPSEVFELAEPPDGCDPCVPGYVVIRFDHPVEDDPLNPCGIDFVIFGTSILYLGFNEPQWKNGDPNLTTVKTDELVQAEPGMVYVSQDGMPGSWQAFENGVYADTFAPTLGRIYDPEHPEPSLPGNLWWGAPTDPTYPLNPNLSTADFQYKTVAEIARIYGYSAGGTGFDLSQLDPPMPWIQYVKVVQQPGYDTPDLDAFADVRGFAFPDLDCDSDVDQDDIDAFEQCATGPEMPIQMPDCERSDFDRDGDVDQEDYGLLQRCRTGPDVLVDWDCIN
jgi:hypothetical protein